MAVSLVVWSEERKPATPSPVGRSNIDVEDGNLTCLDSEFLLPRRPSDAGITLLEGPGEYSASSAGCKSWRGKKSAAGGWSAERGGQGQVQISPAAALDGVEQHRGHQPSDGSSGLSGFGVPGLPSPCTELIALRYVRRGISRKGTPLLRIIRLTCEKAGGPTLKRNRTWSGPQRLADR